MELKGSCHCEKVHFKFISHTPAPVNRIKERVNRLLTMHFSLCDAIGKKKKDEDILGRH